MYKSIIKKKRKKPNKLLLLAKTKLNIIEVLISKALMDSYIKHDNFVLVNNVLKEYNEMKKEVKNSEMLWNVYIKTMETYWTSFENNTVNKNSSVRRPKQNR